MPRTPRIDFPGARHHVMNRTASRRVAFSGPEDLDIFLGVLAEIPGRFHARIHGWALMSNHYHLMIECQGAPLPKVMAWLGGELARKLNLAHGWEGPLFRGRYRNRLVLEDDYWRGLLAYIHLNPVRAGLVPHPDRSVWTSHRAYAGLDPAPAWLVRDELLELYGSSTIYRGTLDDLTAGRQQLPQVFDEGLIWRAAATDASILARVPAATPILTAEEALRQVADLTGASHEELLTGRRGRRGNLSRTLAAWWLVRAAAKSRVVAGALLGMPPSAVGAAVHRVRHASGPLAAWREALLAAWWGPSPEPDETELGGSQKL
ncbi:MAG: transposase [Pseudomonadota bacterium]